MVNGFKADLTWSITCKAIIIVNTIITRFVILSLLLILKNSKNKQPVTISNSISETKKIRKPEPNTVGEKPTINAVQTPPVKRVAISTPVVLSSHDKKIK